MSLAFMPLVLGSGEVVNYVLLGSVGLCPKTTASPYTLVHLLRPGWILIDVSKPIQVQRVPITTMLFTPIKYFQKGSVVSEQGRSGSLFSAVDTLALPSSLAHFTGPALSLHY